jgi:hypothetical protein
MPKFEVSPYDYPLSLHIKVKDHEYKVVSIHIDKGYLVKDSKGERWVGWKKLEAFQKTYFIRGEPFVGEMK